jgi:MFS family permease
MPHPAPARDAASTPGRIHGLGLVALGSVFSIMLTSPVTSLYLDRLGLPPTHIGGVIGAMSLALIVSEVLALGVSSWFGRRLAVLGSLVSCAVMFAWFPLAGSLAGLYLTRLALGAVRGVLWPVLFAEVAESGPSDRLPALFALFWLYFGIGQLLGPALGGWLGEQFSLTAPFFAAALASLATAAAVGAVRSTRDTTPNPLTSYAVLVRRSPAVMRVWLLIIFNTIVYSIYATFLPLHAAARGLSTGEIGLIFTGGGVAFIIAQVLLRRITAQVPPERLLVPSYLARGVGVALTPFLASFPALFAVNFLTTILSASVPPALSMRVTARAPREQLVAAMGGLNAAADLGFFVGPVVGGILAGWGVAWAFALVPVVTLAAVATLLTDPGQPAGERTAFSTPAGNDRPP